MRFRFLLAAAPAFALGCNLITGVGNLQFTDTPNTLPDGAPAAGNDAGPPSGGNDGGGGMGSDGGTSSGGAVPPSGIHPVTSSTLQLAGITSDGWVAYGDTSTNELSALDVEQGDGGAPASSTPVVLGTADLSTAYSLGKLIVFFSNQGESDAGASQVGTLEAWSSSMLTPVTVSTTALVPTFYFPFSASDDGRYLLFIDAVAPNGATGSLVLEDLSTGTHSTVVASIDVLNDGCVPRLGFGGGYAVASYCEVTAGGTIPDAGTDLIATVTSFAAATGAPTTLATNVSSGFGMDPGGTETIMLAPNGIVASPVSGAGGLVSIDTLGASAVISDDGKTVAYTTTSDALKRGNTTAPVSPTILVNDSFAIVDSVSADAKWAIGALTAGTTQGTTDLYAASLTAPGSALPLSTATSAVIGSGGDPFTADSKFALYLTSVGSVGTGTFTTYALGAGGAPKTLGIGGYREHALTGSQVVFNLNYTSGKSDIEWVDLSSGKAPTVLVTQPDEYFVVGPAKDRIVYTYSGSTGGTADGLWILHLPCGDPSSSVVHAPAPGAGSCTDDEVTTYDNACISASATTTSCAGIEATIGAGCYACLDSQYTDSAWGAIVDANAVSRLNIGGCFIQQGQKACGAALQAAFECENNACASQTGDAFISCVTAAITGACGCYAAAADDACDSFVTSPCNPNLYTTFEAGFVGLAKTMCE